MQQRKSSCFNSKLILTCNNLKLFSKISKKHFNKNKFKKLNQEDNKKIQSRERLCDSKGEKSNPLLMFDIIDRRRGWAQRKAISTSECRGALVCVADGLRYKLKMNMPRSEQIEIFENLNLPNTIKLVT